VYLSAEIYIKVHFLQISSEICRNLRFMQKGYTLCSFYENCRFMQFSQKTAESSAPLPAE
jgi:hypothetical protein